MKEHYPDAAGYKERDGTSEEGAERLTRSGRARTLRDQVKWYFDSGRIGTADEVAHALRVHFLSIRPRLSELRKMGLIEPTDNRAKSITGNTATVWRRAFRKDLFE